MRQQATNPSCQPVEVRFKVPFPRPLKSNLMSGPFSTKIRLRIHARVDIPKAGDWRLREAAVAGLPSPHATACDPPAEREGEMLGGSNHALPSRAGEDAP